ncbi:MAG: hypothetical protein IJ106_03680 [Parasporobacterium sp.]|nr:hypothetical protein [Parasporobacterium sp.]
MTLERTTSDKNITGRESGHKELSLIPMRRQPEQVRRHPELLEKPQTSALKNHRVLRSLVIRRRKLTDRKQSGEKSTLRKRLARGGAASVLGLSITVAGLFGTPEELIRQQTINQLHDPMAVELVLDEEDPGSEEDSRKKMETEPAGKGFFRRLADAAKKLVLKVPAPVRAVVGVPLWAIGYGIIHLLSGLYTLVLSPVLSHILGFVLLAAALIAVFAVTMKSILPHMPLKKILSKRNLIFLLIGAAILKLLDLLLPLIWTNYTRYKYLIMLAAGIAVLALNLVPRLLRRFRRIKTAE